MIQKQQIIPHLWFDTEAVEAVEFYCSVFPDSRILKRRVIPDTPSGDCDYLTFELWGQRFEALSGGSRFALNPSISMMVNFDPLFFRDQDDPELAARTKLNELWSQLSRDGLALMELGSYDFSPLYGWIQDRFGMTWQLILTDPGGDPRPSIMPSMLFTGDNCGKAEEAGSFYQSLFPSSEMGMLVKYPPGMGQESVDTVMFSDFRLGDTWITAMDSSYNHQFGFNEALSYMVYCRDQEELDYYWCKLSAVPEAEQCGWLKDRYGVSWQIVPLELNSLMETGSEQQNKAVIKALLDMKKIDLSGLKRVFEGIK